MHDVWWRWHCILCTVHGCDERLCAASASGVRYLWSRREIYARPRDSCKRKTEIISMQILCRGLPVTQSRARMCIRPQRKQHPSTRVTVEVKRQTNSYFKSSEYLSKESNKMRMFIANVLQLLKAISYYVKGKKWPSLPHWYSWKIFRGFQSHQCCIHVSASAYQFPLAKEKLWGQSNFGPLLHEEGLRKWHDIAGRRRSYEHPVDCKWTIQMPAVLYHIYLFKL
jgi:hypothetical protein